VRDEAALAREQREIWERIAPFWSGHIDEEFDRIGYIYEPLDRLLDISPGTMLLDVGCGNGRFARHIAGKGAVVTAIDVASSFIDIASTIPSERITYRVVDATEEDALAALGSGTFDVAVANMVLMNLAKIDPLARGLSKLLKSGGTFVASIPHPCFPWPATVDVNDPKKKKKKLVLRIFALMDRIGNALPANVTRRLAALVVPVLRARRRTYLTPMPRMMAAPGQPVPHYNFHRPLQVLFAPFFAAGFVLDAIDENASISPVEFDRETPGVMVFRMRLAAT
jgi:2-polyprenyl-3-methyl-5-hydroxy-6-metoxy-1,4-benzoquinol methylase